MEPNDRHGTGRTRRDEDDIRASWEDTPRDPRYPNGDVGSCRNDQGTMLYDRTDPGTYLIGSAVDLAEML